MQFAQTRGVGWWLAAAWLVVAGASPVHAQQRAPLFVRVQLEPGPLLARQNGPLTLSLNAAGLTGSVAVGLNVSQSTAVGLEGWVGLALLGSMDITPPAFDGQGDSVSVEGPSLTAILAGPHITHMFLPELVTVSATVGAALGNFDYDTYPLVDPEDPDRGTLPYNTVRSIDPITGASSTRRSHIPLDKTNVGWGFGVVLSKLIPLSDGLSLGLGVQFRYLAIPDDAVYFDDDEVGPLRYRADTWSITSFGAHASIVYF